MILGKANLSEWANFRDDRATSGWSGVGGQTNNPYVLDRNPCGSSSGSGAGVAAALAQVAIGTETDGSIVCPSGAMGLVGLKPTLGLVSRAGIIPISAQQDTAGPMARHVVDAAITMNVIQGKDPQDPATGAIPPDQPRVYRLDGRALEGARIGVWRMAGIDPDVDAIVRALGAGHAGGRSHGRRGDPRRAGRLQRRGHRDLLRVQAGHREVPPGHARPASGDARRASSPSTRPTRSS